MKRKLKAVLLTTALLGASTVPVWASNCAIDNGYGCDPSYQSCGGNTATGGVAYWVDLAVSGLLFLAALPFGF